MGESEELSLHNKACCVNSVMVELWVVNLLTWKLTSLLFLEIMKSLL